MLGNDYIAKKIIVDMTGVSQYGAIEMSRRIFDESGSFFHICSSEDHQVIFRNKEEFLRGMALLGMCVKLYPGLRLVAFQLMSNHFHLFVSGDVAVAEEFYLLFSKLLAKSTGCIEIDAKCFASNSLENAQNVIAYINRNAFVVMPEYTPFNYPWGTNRYYFGGDEMSYYNKYRKPLTFRERRLLSGSHKFDNVEGLFTVDGCVSPLSFCDVELGKSLFKNARHYFYSLARNIESNIEIARQVGEKFSYTDEDVFNAILAFVKERYNCLSINSLTSSQKVETAKKMHFDYNSSNKQVARILKIERGVVDNLFPQSAR